MPTPEQLERARRAGWNPNDGEPPEGWEAHGEFQEGVVPGLFYDLDDALNAQVGDE